MRDANIMKTKMILILEDDEIRIKVFKRFLQDHVLYITDDTNIAVDFYRKNKIDVMFLDHDLAEEHYEGYSSSTKGTGADFARFLNDNGFYGEDTIIHSFNPAGADNMKAFLPKARIIRFNDLVQMFKKGQIKI